MLRMTDFMTASTEGWKSENRSRRTALSTDVCQSIFKSGLGTANVYLRCNIPSRANFSSLWKIATKLCSSLLGSDLSTHSELKDSEAYFRHGYQTSLLSVPM